MRARETEKFGCPQQNLLANENKIATRWRKLEKQVNKLIRQGQRIVVMRYNQKHHAIDYLGSQGMLPFSLNPVVQKLFLNSCVAETDRKLPENYGLPNLDPDDINLPNLRKVVTDLVRTDSKLPFITLFKRVGFVLGYFF